MEMEEQPDVRQKVELRLCEADGARFPVAQADDFETRRFHSDPTNTPPGVVTMKRVDDRRFQEAVEVCRAWTQLEPDNPLAFGLLGQAYEKPGKPDEARQAFAEAGRLSGNPTH